MALTTGLIFGIGLAVSAMTNPSVVQHFLRLDADWNPALMFVMAFALLVSLAGFYVILKRDEPVLGCKFHLPTETRITPSLVAGAILFGVGWGLAGICPGPGVVTLVIGSLDYYAWFLAQLGGMFAYYFISRTAAHVGSAPGQSAAAVSNPFASTAALGAPALATTTAGASDVAYHRLGVE